MATMRVINAIVIIISLQSIWLHGILFRQKSSECEPDIAMAPTKLLVRPRTAIFLHRYVPIDDDQKGALMIIKEQLEQIGNALSILPRSHQTKLFYINIGRKLGDGFVENICSQFSEYLSCHLLRHADAGFEEQTLSAVHEYCVEHDDHRVLYLHTKGSYHPNEAQNNWRRSMTDAVSSLDCMEHALFEGCSMCGLLFLPRPVFHYTGNMFNAQCSYIRKLLKPSIFQEKMVEVVALERKLLQNGTLVPNMKHFERPAVHGSQRYVMEHWHGSHPSLEKVCDVSIHPQNVFKRTGRQPDNWELASFPRHPYTASWQWGDSDRMIAQVLNTESNRMREIFLLPGQMMRWCSLYGELPSNSSWVWSWYPDGQFWRQEAEKHGCDVIHIPPRRWTK